MKNRLFEPIEIGKITIPNRFMRSATWEGMCEEDGKPTPRLSALYSELTKGGVGLIVTGYTYIHPRGKQMIGTLGAWSDDLVPSLTEVADAVHRAGGRVFSQLMHAGAQTSQRATGNAPLGPSPVPSPFYSGIPEKMSPGQIKSTVKDFTRAAARIKAAGFDGVQLHAAHGYLINQFLSPMTNRRDDKYGGSARNRFRFLEEVVSAVRGDVGDDFPLTVKLSGSDNLEGGIRIDDAVEAAVRLQELGIDAIEVSAGTSGSGDGVPVRKGINSLDREGYNADYSIRIKKKVNVPVILVGGLRSFSLIERLLAEGYADMFALSRPLIREPNLVNIWREDSSHRATCISCNLCFRPGMREGGIYCVVERKLAEHKERKKGSQS
ncbi:MAG: NADH:flavin oxidoreductase [bacterium]